MQLATKTTYPIEQLLDDWRWLLPDEVELVIITKSGDAFVRRRRDGVILWLNVVEGAVEQVAATLDEFQAAITDQQNVQAWFMADVLWRAGPIGGLEIALLILFTVLRPVAGPRAPPGCSASRHLRPLHDSHPRDA